MRAISLINKAPSAYMTGQACCGPASGTSIIVSVTAAADPVKAVPKSTALLIRVFFTRTK